MGYPGSGKTTVSRVIHELTGAVHLCADLIRRERLDHDPTYSEDESQELYNHLNEVASELLGTGESVIYDTGFNLYKDRQLMEELARHKGAAYQLIWVQAPEDLAHTRATQDAEQQQRVQGNMTNTDFERLVNKFQPPQDGEQVIEVDGTKVSPTYIANLLHLPQSS